ncbi:hypothetical protein PG984_014690 [Apiospora sp. TS-2023a]
MAPIPQQVTGHGGPSQLFHQRSLQSLLQRRDGSFTPDGQFFLLLSVATIAFVMFVGFGVALCLRRRRYEKFDDLPSMDNGGDQGDIRIWNRWHWLSGYAPKRLFRSSSLVEIAPARTINAPPRTTTVSVRPRELSTFVSAPTKRPAAVPQSEALPAGAGAQQLAAVPPATVNPERYWNPTRQS